VTPDSQVSQQQKQTQGRDTATSQPISLSISQASISTLKNFSKKRVKNIVLMKTIQKHSA